MCSINYVNIGNNICVPYISEIDMREELLSMKQSTGDDGNPVYILQNLVDSLVLPLSLLFNKSLQCHIVHNVPC